MNYGLLFLPTLFLIIMCAAAYFKKEYATMTFLGILALFNAIFAVGVR